MTFESTFKSGVQMPKKPKAKPRKRPPVSGHYRLNCEVRNKQFRKEYTDLCEQKFFDLKDGFDHHYGRVYRQLSRSKEFDKLSQAEIRLQTEGTRTSGLASQTAISRLTTGPSRTRLLSP